MISNPAGYIVLVTKQQHTGWTKTFMTTSVKFCENLKSFNNIKPLTQYEETFRE